MSYDELMIRVGELGPFQFFFLFLMGLTKIVCGSHVLLSVFASYRRPYWCRLWGNMTTHAFICSPTNISTNNVSNDNICPQSEWQFDQSIIESTIQSQYGLVCDREMLVPLATTFFMAGFLVGSSIYGFLSDRFGRVKMSSILALHSSIVSLGISFAPYYQLYVLGRFLMGVAVGGTFAVANPSCVEILTAKWRLLGMIIASLFWSVGELILLLVAYLVRTHTYLQLIISFITVPGIFCYLLFPEPLRWSIVNNHLDEAFKTAKKIARLNRKSPLSREEFDDYVQRMTTTFDNKDEDKNLSTWQRFKDQFQFLSFKHLRRVTFILWFLFAATYFITNSFTFSIGRFDDNIYRNVLIMIVIIPIKEILLGTFGNMIGRVKMIIILYSVTVVLTFSLTGLYKVEYYEQYAIWLALIVKLFLVMIILVVCLACSEVYPTQFRASALGSCLTWGCVGSLISPQVINLDLIWRPLPFFIYGGVAVLAFISSIFLPETKGIATLETVNDGELFCKENHLWRKRSKNIEL